MAMVSLIGLTPDYTEDYYFGIEISQDRGAANVTAEAKR
jgi:hypothetical protein